MKFAIYRSSADGCMGIRNFNTLEEVMRFKKKNRHAIIVMENPLYQENVEIVKEYNPQVDANELVTIPYAIEIYDDYR